MGGAKGKLRKKKICIGRRASGQLFAVDGCRVHANCHPKDAEHVPLSVLHPYPYRCPFLPLSAPNQPVRPDDLYARSGLGQRSFLYNFLDVVQTFLPSGKQDRSSWHLACLRPRRPSLSSPALQLLAAP